MDCYTRSLLSFDKDFLHVVIDGVPRLVQCAVIYREMCFGKEIFYALEYILDSEPNKDSRITLTESVTKLQASVGVSCYDARLNLTDVLKKIITKKGSSMQKTFYNAAKKAEIQYAGDDLAVILLPLNYFELLLIGVL